MKYILAMTLATMIAGTGVFAKGLPVTDTGSDVSVERSPNGGYRVSWPQWRATPVDLFVADRPDAPVSERRQLADDDRDGTADVTVHDTRRPYFFVQPAKGNGHWVAERLLPLEGGRNFRDLGGYRASDGRTVRWGKIYRSGSMSGLTAQDFDYLGRLGIRSVYDLRTERERKGEPNRWATAAQIGYWARDYAMSGGDLSRLADPKVTAAEARQLMAESYRAIPYEQAPAYREMFRQLASGQTPLAFNCTIGKDRAGIAAALVLTALGVPRETVVADYGLTNRYLPMALERDKAINPKMAALPRHVAEVLLVADPAYLEMAFEEMSKRNGSPEGYLREVIGLSAADQARLKAFLLE